jgi:hypothetical protein
LVTGKLDVRDAARQLPEERSEPELPGPTHYAEVVEEPEDVTDNGIEA